MNIAELVKRLIQLVYYFSPYFWVDRYYKLRELDYVIDSHEWQSLRNRRLFLSEFYIVGWLALSFVLMVSSIFYPLSYWLIPFLFLRIVGIVNKELGVILFGICKITEGTAVSATGRVIVLAMVNYLTAMFLFATIYQINGLFEDVPAYLVQAMSLGGIIQALQIHFTMSGAFAPADLFTWAITVLQGVFCFMFGTIVISLFVSLLNVKPLNK
ncbi:hypothetical protein [Thiomicrorhabdus xiamenensis]|uniref:Uncharacterized protein n=1 Tax=Thiomicrorhabdus xiamenensis TaxID=2739063 RepID=A0A7D4NP55_9GAMM|nr:hypothetical protein [Thiomicrorhabdus xiamenensis]QKI89333.1 hypothetical protein HQN79_07025 [Thiomicrorhabdus xiamenensis]